MKADSGLRLTGRQVKALKGMRWHAKKARDCRLMARCQAVLMMNRRRDVAWVAETVGVHVNSVRGWIRRVLKGGVSALKDKPYPGAKPKLGPDQKEELKAIVANPPTAAGFDTGVWTGPLVKELIKKRFGVEYDVSQVRRILNQLGFSVQYPRVRLSKADAEKQKEWIQTTLPEIKKKSAKRMVSSCSRTKSFSRSRGAP